MPADPIASAQLDRKPRDPFREGRVVASVDRLEHGESRSHGDGVGREGAGLVDGTVRREHLEHVAPAAECADRKPAADHLAEAPEIRGHPGRARCAPGPTLKPVITSSKTSSAPASSHARRSPSKNPGSGATRPMLAANGLDDHARDGLVELRTRLKGATTVSATAPRGTPAESGSPRVATPLPPPARSRSECPW